MQKLFLTQSEIGEYLFRIVDNGGATADRYTVAFSDGDYLALSENPSAPWGGVSLWCEGIDPAWMESEVEEGRAVCLGWGDLPERIRAHILGRLNQGFADFLDHLTRWEPPTRDGAEDNEGGPGSAGVGIYRAPGGLFIRRDDGDDLGPYETARDALLNTLPQWYDCTGPEYHSRALDGTHEDAKPDPGRLAAVADLEARVEAERAA